MSLVLIALLASLALAQTSPYDAAKAEMTQRIDAERKAAVGNADRKVWDFVIADRKTKTVTLLAVATSIKPTDPTEFFVTPYASGKDYESLAVTFATPGDVRAALDFIGLKPGLPIDPETNRYWPRGPRVLMTFKVGNGQPLRAEALVVDTNTNKPLPSNGLIYTGSLRYTDKATGQPRVAADDNPAGPIAPTYNDPAALFDVPAQAPQSTVYGFRKPSPAFAAKPGESIDITMSEGTGADGVVQRAAAVRAELIDGQARFAIRSYPEHEEQRSVFRPTVTDDLPHFVAALGERVDEKSDLFTTVHIAPDVPISDVRNLYGVLQAVEKDRGIKLDAPLPGELFHRAFFPQHEWRDRATRLGEPWELFLYRDPAGKLTAKLERSVDNPDRNAVEPKVVESMMPADPAAFKKHVDDHASRWSRTIFVYPQADLTYGELMAWVRPVLPTYSRLFVFPAGAPTTRPATGLGE